MQEKLILILCDNCKLYRLHMYYDFLERFSSIHDCVKIYGPGFTENTDVFIKDYRRDKDINAVIKENLNGVEPDIIFFISMDLAPSDFSKLKSRVYVFLSDSVETNIHAVKYYQKHKGKYSGVFHNYLYKQELINEAFNVKNRFYFPCWSSLRYDYEQNKEAKKIDFFMAGATSKEYEYREKFGKLFSNPIQAIIHRVGVAAKRPGLVNKPRRFANTKLTYINRFNLIGESSPDQGEHDVFTRLLARSRFSPHDGGINGRMQGRFYESGFMKSVIISPDLGEEMTQNGFINGVNCVLFDRREPIPKVKDRLKNIDSLYDWNELSANAYDHIKNHHTTYHRIKSFLNIVLND